MRGWRNSKSSVRMSACSDKKTCQHLKVVSDEIVPAANGIVVRGSIKKLVDVREGEAPRPGVSEPPRAGKRSLSLTLAVVVDFSPCEVWQFRCFLTFVGNVILASHRTIPKKRTPDPFASSFLSCRGI